MSTHVCTLPILCNIPLIILLRIAETITSLFVLLLVCLLVCFLFVFCLSGFVCLLLLCLFLRGELLPSPPLEKTSIVRCC